MSVKVLSLDRVKRAVVMPSGAPYYAFRARVCVCAVLRKPPRDVTPDVGNVRILLSRFAGRI